MSTTRQTHAGVAVIMAAFLLAGAVSAPASVYLGAEQYVQAGGFDIDVPGYSVPSFVFWNGDDLPDLVVGQGSGTTQAKVRVYLNVGTAEQPVFPDYFFVQSEGVDLVVTGGG